MRNSIRCAIAIVMMVSTFSAAKADDIVDTAVAAGKFKTLRIDRCRPDTRLSLIHI